MNHRFAVITVSDKACAGQREDTAGPKARSILSVAGFIDAGHEIVPDEMQTIRERLIFYADSEHVSLVVTCGGTGFAPRDVTPEATRLVIEREAPGLAEAMRARGLKHTPNAMLSRAVAGIRGQTLIVNLPGSEKAVSEGLDAILLALPHALELLAGETHDCGR